MKRQCHFPVIINAEKSEHVFFRFIFIYLLKSTYETNKANDITVGQKGT